MLTTSKELLRSFTSADDRQLTISTVRSKVLHVAAVATFYVIVPRICSYV